MAPEQCGACTLSDAPARQALDRVRDLLSRLLSVSKGRGLRCRFVASPCRSALRQPDATGLIQDNPSTGVGDIPSEASPANGPRAESRGAGARYDVIDIMGCETSRSALPQWPRAVWPARNSDRAQAPCWRHPSLPHSVPDARRSSQERCAVSETATPG